MVKLIVVVDKQGKIQAAAKLSPENKYSPTIIEASGDESVHEITMPDELEAEGLARLVDYNLSSEGEPRLVKRSAAQS